MSGAATDVVDVAALVGDVGLTCETDGCEVRATWSVRNAVCGCVVLMCDEHAENLRRLVFLMPRVRGTCGSLRRGVLAQRPAAGAVVSAAPAAEVAAALFFGVAVSLLICACAVWDDRRRRRRRAQERAAREASSEGRRAHEHASRQAAALRRVIDREVARMRDEDGSS